jgi:hypothetical protein
MNLEKVVLNEVVRCGSLIGTVVATPRVADCDWIGVDCWRSPDVNIHDTNKLNTDHWEFDSNRKFAWLLASDCEVC